MPRKGRGGERQGTPGTAYGNRSDLNMPISTVPGQDYGKASAQQAAQSAVPMGQSPVSNLQQAPAMPTPQAAPLPQPGSMPWLHPTNRPNEPVTAGLPFGPGASAPEPSRDVIRVHYRQLHALLVHQVLFQNWQQLLSQWVFNG